MEMGVIPQQQDELASQMKQAQALRSRQAPQGREVGNVYVAANPLEHLASGIERYKAGKQVKELQAQSADLMGKQTKGRRAFLEALVTKRTPPATSIDPSTADYND
jgi:small-conductance mechanosensitive channel